MADFVIQVGGAVVLGLLVDVMLPIHRRRSPSPTSAGQSTSGSASQSLNKKSYRWLLYLVAFASSFWLLAPYVIGPLDPRHGPSPHQYDAEDHLRADFEDHTDSPSAHALPHVPPPRLRPGPPSPPASGTSNETVWSIRANDVRNAYLHAWTGYLKLAAPADELLPVSNAKTDKFVVSTFTGRAIFSLQS